MHRMVFGGAVSWLPAGRGQVAGEFLKSTNKSPQHAGVREVVDQRRLEVGVGCGQ